MKKNAFTLIEVLTVIVLLVTISLIAIFSISAIVKQSGENLYQLQIDSVLDASRTYAISHADNFAGTTQITICDLKRAGLLRDDFVNPQTDEKFDDSLIIEITKDNFEAFSFNFDAETVMPDYACDLNGLGVTLIGDSPYYVNIGSEISVPGVEVVDKNGNRLSEEVDYKLDFEDNIENNGNKYSKIGQYYRKYTIVDDNIVDGKQFKTTITRIIIVEDKTAPIITINGSNNSFTVTTLVGEAYSVPACTATDNDQTPKCDIVNNYDGKVNTPGTYDIIYTATDASGNTNTLVVTVIVKAKTKDLIGQVKLSELNWTNKDVTLSIEPLYNKNNCNDYLYFYSYAWHATNQAVFSTNGTYRLGIKYDSSKCSNVTSDDDSFEYEITNIDKEAPTFYKDVGTNGNHVYESQANINIEFTTGATSRNVKKSETINEKQVIHNYYYTNGAVTLSNPTGATDASSGVSNYTIYINGEKKDDINISLTTDGKYIVELTATDLATNESEKIEVAVVIIDTQKPVCQFAACATNSECTTTKPAIQGSNISYAGGSYRVQLSDAKYQQVNYKFSCTDNYYVGEDDELEIKNFSLSRVQIVGESKDDPELVSTVAARENLGTESDCKGEVCTRTYSYIITINVGKALVPNEFMNIRLLKDAIQDKAGNYNANSWYSMDLKKIQP